MRQSSSWPCRGRGPAFWGGKERKTKTCVWCGMSVSESRRRQEEQRNAAARRCSSRDKQQERKAKSETRALDQDLVRHSAISASLVPSFASCRPARAVIPAVAVLLLSLRPAVTSLSLTDTHSLPVRLPVSLLQASRSPTSSSFISPSLFPAFSSIVFFCKHSLIRRRERSVTNSVTQQPFFPLLTANALSSALESHDECRRSLALRILAMFVCLCQITHSPSQPSAARIIKRSCSSEIKGSALCSRKRHRSQSACVDWHC